MIQTPSTTLLSPHWCTVATIHISHKMNCNYSSYTNITSQKYNLHHNKDQGHLVHENATFFPLQVTDHPDVGNISLFFQRHQIYTLELPVQPPCWSIFIEGLWKQEKVAHHYIQCRSLVMAIKPPPHPPKKNLSSTKIKFKKLPLCSVLPVSIFKYSSAIDN